ncbi:hypothetical protein DFH06DRAFT_185829 [Mycena polygramma]|nr:hypothetical protein DFH06DRAFT_185829 [Mycena polygramma]
MGHSYEVADVTSSPTSSTGQITNVVTQISTAQITTTDVQKIPTTQTSNNPHPPSTNAAPSIHSSSVSATPAASTSKRSSLTSATPPATALADSSVAPASPALSPSSAPSSSSPALPRSNSKRFNYVPVLAATIPAVVLIVTVGILCWRRRRARRVNISDTESHNGSAAPLFGSTTHSVYGGVPSRPVSGSHRATINSGFGNGETERMPLGSQFADPESRHHDGGVQMREKSESGGSHFTPSSPFPAERSENPLSLSPPASVYSFDNSPPPRYCQQRPLPTLPL